MMDYVKQALFNVLQNHLSFAGLQVLDLFAGSGQLGIECLSRGAHFTIFNDHSTIAIQTIKNNLNAVKRQMAKTTVIRCDFRALIAYCHRHQQKFNLIFVDPPFRRSAYLSIALHHIKKFNLLMPGGIVAMQTTTSDVVWPATMQLLFARELKSKWIMLLC